jgi:hypothetical protein
MVHSLKEKYDKDCTIKLSGEYDSVYHFPTLLRISYIDRIPSSPFKEPVVGTGEGIVLYIRQFELIPPEED